MENTMTNLNLINRKCNHSDYRQGKAGANKQATNR